jgi:hypothetical protein
LKGTIDSTYYTHYSTLSTVQANWQLKNLGRNDINKTMSNVFSLVANVTGYTNLNVPAAERPMTNLTGIYSGPLNPNAYVPFTAPANQSAIGAGGQGVLTLAGLNTSFTPSLAPAPVNLTSQGQQDPWSIDPTAGASSSTTSGKPNGAAISLSISRSNVIVAAIIATGTLFV